MWRVQVIHARAVSGRVAVDILDRTGVGNLVSEFLGNRSATDHDLDLVAETGFVDGLDRSIQGRHGGGQKSGQSHELALGMVAQMLDESLGGNVDAQVGNLNALALDHHANEVLADVMHVACDGADDAVTERLGAASGHSRLQNVGASGHSASCNQHLGNEALTLGEALADDAHGFDHGIEDFLGIHTLIQSLLYERTGFLPLALDCLFAKIVKNSHDAPLS